MGESTVRIMCPNLTCRKVLAVPAVARGKTVRCRSCGTNIRVPETKKAPKPTEQPQTNEPD
ncbi:MAG: hypothetical protein LAT64_08240 [Phycisphaerales bacterium]|nr:hypothetical protein [Planctomycetota bacterium]MCH8508744.1 hypothetical protein [Phycisphaerales bacterium]